MHQQVHVHLLPSLVEPEELAGQSVVVIDTLRASTTICHALQAGAENVIPCEDIEQARIAAAELPRQLALLGGERDGIRIDGFDLGNSPRAYTPEVVAGKTIVFTTTNGTRAVAKAHQAAEIVIGTLNNAQAVALHLASTERVSLLCAGTQGRVTSEDVLAAGAIAERLSRIVSGEFVFNDEAAIARALYGDGNPNRIGEILRESRGGKNLRRLKYDADIDVAAELDSLSLVPRYDREQRAIKA